jgi:hypothetical protein
LIPKDIDKRRPYSTSHENLIETSSSHRKNISEKVAGEGEIGYRNSYPINRCDGEYLG